MFACHNMTLLGTNCKFRGYIVTYYVTHTSKYLGLTISVWVGISVLTFLTYAICSQSLLFPFPCSPCSFSPANLFCCGIVIPSSVHKKRTNCSLYLPKQWSLWTLIAAIRSRHQKPAGRTTEPNGGTKGCREQW